ncbi:MAG: hypothetical protein M1822_007125 [Bathelium mastoideum]|nr:MAG: hypothetical protein M1822_007125 [Bathelium mastoideum]
MALAASASLGILYYITAPVLFPQLKTMSRLEEIVSAISTLGGRSKPNLGPLSVLIVDVGGGKGHDLQQFISHYPESKGSFILQDLPEVIAEVNGLHSRITPMVHDFFTPQPVKGHRKEIDNASTGACPYFMHSTLHDWPDNDARTILRFIAAAMQPDRSRLLIHEHVVPEVNASRKMTAHDLTMMTNFASLERSFKQWQSLLHASVLEIAGVWTKDADSERIIEAVLATSGEAME